MPVRVTERIADLTCAPEPGVRTALLRDVALHLGCLPVAARRATGPGLWLFDQAARLRHGRRFTRLDDARADAYLRRVLYGRAGPVATVVRLVKSVVVLCYYELPSVKQALGYRPDAYVAEVSARRIALYGNEIRAAER
jgi:hypothetical protein